MAVYDLRLIAGFSTAARRDSIRGEIETRIADRPRWQLDTLESQAVTVPLDDGKVTYPHGLVAEFRFVSEIDRDDLELRIKDRAAGVRAPLDGSTISVHLCFHDENGECGPWRHARWLGGVLVAA